MSNAFRPVDPVIDQLIGGKIVAHRPAFARAFGGATIGLLLSQFWYYSMMETATQRDGWFYAPQEEIEEDTGLTRTEQETARRKLREAGIIEESKAGIPAKLYYRINKERAVEQLRLFLTRDAEAKTAKMEKKESRRQERRERAGLSAENLQTRTAIARAQERRERSDKPAQKPPAIPKTPLKNTKTTPKTATPPAAHGHAGSGQPVFATLSEEEKRPWRDESERQQRALVGVPEGKPLSQRLIDARARTLYEASEAARKGGRAGDEPEARNASPVGTPQERAQVKALIAQSLQNAQSARKGKP